MGPKSPITVCLYTSAKGHFGRTDLYQQTVTSLLSQVPRENWGGLLAHIKHTPSQEESNRCNHMAMWLETQGFTPFSTMGEWKHGDDSHQTGYLLDCAKIVGMVTTPYVLHQEDDFITHPYVYDLDRWLHEAVALLEKDPSLVQVRVPRFSNEFDRILGLRQKHGIDGRAEWVDDKHFRHTDWSNNVYVARTRDLRAALSFVMHSNLPKHSEHGVGAAMKLLSGAPLPFACFNPDLIRCSHLGVATPAEEDDLSKPLLAN